MLQFDQESRPAPQGAYGVSGTAGGHGRLLDAIAREIEDTQRQQSETMAHIVERLRAVDAERPAQAQPAARRRNHLVLGDADDELWDNDTAEALMQSYEADDAIPARLPARAPARASTSKSAQDWIGERFNEVTQRITQTLTDLKPGSTMTLLEARLDEFQKIISSALEDVVRRADLDGMRMIEVHVHDLGDKLDELERHVSRLDGIETDVRNVMGQVSDERIAKLLDYDSRFAADLDAVALKAAEQVHTRLGNNDGEQAAADSRRHEELRALIEASIEDRREAEAQTVSLVTGLSGRVSAQSDRYDELKGLMEHAIHEQRQNEQTAFGMLETLQQALVTVLDRMDVIEQQQLHAALSMAPPPAPQPAPAEEPVLAPAPEPRLHEERGLLVEDPAAGDAPYTFRDTRFNTSLEGPESPSPVEIPAAFAETPTEYVVADDPESPLDRLRRDFIADARRAKLKAAANRAEASSEPTEPAKPSAIAQARAALTQASRAPLSIGSGRLFGMSTKLLAGVLALIIAINGGLLLFNRKHASKPVAPEIAHPVDGAVGGQAPAATPPNGGTGNPAAGAPNPGPRSDLHGGAGGQAFAPYGYHDDVLDPPEVETMGATGVPHGVTIARPGGSLPEEAVADVYEQQVLASLSGKLGMLAAGQNANALLPEGAGRVDAAYPVPDVAPGNEAAAARTTTLDLPPATVGPLSLRLAAANGDASAEFEVAARMAEGNGTSQNFGEALHWYQRSAAKGFAQAQYRLGTLYERGLGVKKDLERAKVWYGRAAEQGNVKSMHNLAVLSAGGDGKPDYAAAAPWFLKAAENGLADSQYNLGVLLENGLSGTTDRTAAYKWYALAAKGGDQDAVARRDALKLILNADELAAADGMIAAFQALVPAPLANDARAAGEDWKKRVNNDTNG